MLCQWGPYSAPYLSLALTGTSKQARWWWLNRPWLLFPAPKTEPQSVTNAVETCTRMIARWSVMAANTSFTARYVLLLATIQCALFYLFLFRTNVFRECKYDRALLWKKPSFVVFFSRTSKLFHNFLFHVFQGFQVVLLAACLVSSITYEALY